MTRKTKTAPLIKPFWGIALILCLGCQLAGGCALINTPTPPPPRPRAAAIPANAIKMTPQTDNAPPVLHSNEWQNPVPLPGAVNTAGAEDSPFITPDGHTLYFFFTPDVAVPPEKQLLDGVTGIYVSRLQGSAWGAAERVLLQNPGKLALDGCPFWQADTLWFCSAREGYTGIRFFTAQFRDNRWGNWQSTDPLFKPGYEVGELHLTADGQELYFHSARPGGQGGLDLWVTRWANNAWQEPQNLAVVNSPENEGWPFVSQDRSELWFTRTYQGSPAIYRSRWDGRAWSAPQLIVSQLAGEPTLDNRRNLYFVHHFFKDGQMVEADLYVAYRR